jgi:LPS sulfotransferase NodH
VTKTDVELMLARRTDCYQSMPLQSAMQRASDGMAFWRTHRHLLPYECAWKIWFEAKIIGEAALRFPVVWC